MREASGRVSVVIATYNRAAVVGRAAESVLGQSHPDLEVLVVDDGSTDETREVVASIARDSPRPVRYCWKPNGGCASARNVGLRLATGDFIAYLDSDDVWLPSAAATLVKALVDGGGDLVYSPAIEVDPRGRERLNRPVAAGRPERLAVEHFLDTNVRAGAYMFRAALLDEAGFVDEDLSHNEDSDFLQRLALHGTAVYAPDPTVRVYTHAGGKSRDRVAIGRALLRSSRRVLAEYPGFAEQLGPAADARLAELERGLVEALVLAGRIAAAREQARRFGAALGLGTRVALRLGIGAPLRVQRLAEAVLGGLTRRSAMAVRPS